MKRPSREHLMLWAATFLIALVCLLTPFLAYILAGGR